MKKYVFFLLVCLLFDILGGFESSSFDIIESENNKAIYSSTNVGDSEFSLDIFKEIIKGDENKNIVISPFSISSALTMVYQGARNSTRESMKKTLHYQIVNIDKINGDYKKSLSKLIKHDKDLQVDMSNSIWIDEGKEVCNDFIKVNQDIFNAHVLQLNLSNKQTLDKINKWIEESTNNKIHGVIDTMPRGADMYLINAVYFKGKWMEKFNKKNTCKQNFYCEDGRIIEVMMMSKTGQVKYGNGEDYEVIKLDYVDGKTSMYVVLPNQGKSVNSFIEQMNRSKWEAIKNKCVVKDNVSVNIPRFTMEYGIKNLEQSMTNLGMGIAFTKQADFSGIGDNLAISGIAHKAVIDINEEGSEGSVTTVVKIERSTAVDFIANRPFLFVVCNNESDTILFIGKMDCPE